MTRTPTLSVCVPTHGDWAELLRQALDSVVDQLTPDLAERIEICVSDNASSGDVAGLVASYRARHPRVVYNRNARDMGFPFNIRKVVEIASGDYCWLLSSDDQLAEGALRRALDLLEKHRDATGITTNRVNLDLALEEPVEQEPLEYLPIDPGREHVYRSETEIWLNCALVFSYISTQVVDRRLWLAAMDEMDAQPVPAMQHFSYVGAIGLMVKRKPVWVWCPDRLARCRWSHSYLAESGDALHLAPEFISEQADLWAHLLGRRSDAYRALVKRVIPVWASSSAIQHYKAAAGGSAVQSLRLGLRFLRRFGDVPDFWRTSVIALAEPAWVARAGVPARRSAPLPPEQCQVRIELEPFDELSPGLVVHLRGLVSNLSRSVLPTVSPHPVRISARWLARGKALSPSRRTELPRPIAAGATAEVMVGVATPTEPGDYELRVTLVQERVAWFDDIDPLNATDVRVRVRQPTSRSG